MYVKTMMDEGWLLLEVPHEVNFGKHAVHGNADGGDGDVDPIELEWGEFPFAASQLWVGLIDFEARSEYEKGQGMIGLNCAWWLDDDLGTVAVVTGRPIFILGADGQTIDRV